MFERYNYVTIGVEKFDKLKFICRVFANQIFLVQIKMTFLYRNRDSTVNRDFQRDSTSPIIMLTSDSPSWRKHLCTLPCGREVCYFLSAK